MNLNNLPEFIDLEQVSDGWIKKYILHYRKPDGTPYSYESSSRKSLEAYRAELLMNRKRQHAALASTENKLESCAAPTNSDGSAITCDAVCMVPKLPDGSYLMIREFRYPLNALCLAFPAGLIDQGETLEQAVDRELREETGFCIRQSAETPLRALVQPGFSSTGMSDESVQVVFVQVEKAEDAHPESSEIIEPFIVQPSEIRTLLNDKTYLIGTRTQLILELLAQQAS